MVERGRVEEIMCEGGKRGALDSEETQKKRPELFPK